MFSPPITFASWLLVGPPLPTFIAIAILILGMITMLRFRFTQRTIALLTAMGLMVMQSVVMVLIMHFRLLQTGQHLDIGRTATWLGQQLLGLDFRLAEVGVVAAICVGAYIEFVRSRLNLSKAFPNLSFYDQTDDLAMTVRKLAATADIEPPNLCLVDNGAPCAFTIRTRGKYTIALSIGLLESFDAEEVEACLAHEIAHIKNRDFALRTLVTMARVALFAKVLSYFIEAAFYRTRELLADRTAAVLIGGPGPLISALAKLREANLGGDEMSGSAICLFNAERDVIELLSKHPSLTTRIRMLKEMKTVIHQNELTR